LRGGDSFILAVIKGEVSLADLKESHMAIAGIVLISSVALYMLEQLEDLTS
jgi:hypothetical protein